MEKFEQEERLSLVEKQRQEAFDTVLEKLEEAFKAQLKHTFESHGREYRLTSVEDCMVAFAQQRREAVEDLYNTIKEENNYRSEQAIAKLHELFVAYEKTVALYAELRSYYPTSAPKVEAALPPLSEIASHGSAVWNTLTK
jgi:hypothetical protein